ncbi:MAG: peptidase [Caulobacteraceae bacterium]|nr:peptidase [Caulobacteraceae bacterium]
MINFARRTLVALTAGLGLVAGFPISSLGAAQAASLRALDDTKYAAIVIDANSGEVLYSSRPDSPRYPASISKVMTLYLVFDALEKGTLKLDEMIPVSAHAAAQAPTKLGLKAGDRLTVDDAIRAMCTLSANDMAVAMAERIGGTEDRFANLMTVKAQQLGMTGSHFANANGLPDARQISTARDIALLSRSIMRDFPQYYGYFGIQEFTFRGRLISNHNHLLAKMPGVDGLKTGFTSASGYNLAASAVRDGHRLIAVVLGGSSTSARDANVEDLLMTGFDIESRRDSGERIALTQTLFEAPRMSAAITPSLDQGDADEGDEAPARPAAIAAKRPAAPAVDQAGGAWKVQVGAFKSRTLAQSQLTTLAKRYDSLFGDAGTTVSASGANYRAQFTGFSQGDAQAACSTLKAAKAPCLATKN